MTKLKKKLNFYVLIVKPNFSCSTKIVYSKLANYSKAKYNKPKKSLLSINSIINSTNELENVVIKKYPKLKNLKLFLSKLPNIIFERMTGSGSSVVAYFYSNKAADIGAKKFRKKYKNYLYITSKTI